MSRSVAFLRGINVGGHRVTKDELIAVFTDEGLSDVDTFLASGNVLFTPTADTSEEALGAALAERLGYAVPTTVRTRAQIELLAAADPFPKQAIETAVSKPQVILLFEQLSAATTKAILERSCEEDLLVPDEQAVHWLPAAGVSGSGLEQTELLKLVGQNTVRTANTLQRLIPKL